MKSKALFTAWLSVLAFFLVLPAANAYLDPGTGSLIFQVAVGAFMAVSLTIKVFWRRIVSFFSRRSTDKT
jgi:hypothetical protein